MDVVSACNNDALNVEGGGKFRTLGIAGTEAQLRTSPMAVLIVHTVPSATMNI
jgi:hypothetical protein